MTTWKCLPLESGTILAVALADKKKINNKKIFKKEELLKAISSSCEG